MIGASACSLMDQHLTQPNAPTGENDGAAIDRRSEPEKLHCRDGVRGCVQRAGQVVDDDKGNDEVAQDQHDLHRHDRGADVGDHFDLGGCRGSDERVETNPWRKQIGASAMSVATSVDNADGRLPTKETMSGVARTSGGTCSPHRYLVAGEDLAWPDNKTVGPRTSGCVRGR
jgi:hypothetical protein